MWLIHGVLPPLMLERLLEVFLRGEEVGLGGGGKERAAHGGSPAFLVFLDLDWLI